jgi:hypothetical protein
LKVDIYTIDNDTAYLIAQDEKVINLVLQVCEKVAREEHKGYDRYQVTLSTLRPSIMREELYYYPLFITQSDFRGTKFNSFLDGRRILGPSQVVGYRQYSFSKTFLATFIASEAVIGTMTALSIDSFTTFYAEMISTIPYVAIISGVLAYLAMSWPHLSQWRHKKHAQRIKQKYTSQKAQERFQHYKAQYYEHAGYQQTGQQQYQHYGQKQWQYQEHDQTLSGFEQEVARRTDYYTVLGLDPKKKSVYTQEEIKKAYHTAALKNHPDLQPPEKKKEMSEKFKLINQAFAVLSVESKRKMYNQGGRESVR